LQSSGVGRVIVAGVATSGGTVLSTARWAYDVGYEVNVCADACDDPDPRALIASGDFDESWPFHLRQEHQRVHRSGYGLAA
jgi:nicotinamidase-related amidase